MKILRNVGGFYATSICRATTCVCSALRLLLMIALTIAPPALAQTSFPGAGLGPIPDGGAACGPTTTTPLDTTFAVSGLTGTLSDLDVSITFAPAHTWGGDVTATLLEAEAALALDRP